MSLHRAKPNRTHPSPNHTPRCTAHQLQRTSILPTQPPTPKPTSTRSDYHQCTTSTPSPTTWEESAVAITLRTLSMRRRESGTRYVRVSRTRTCARLEIVTSSSCLDLRIRAPNGVQLTYANQKFDDSRVSLAGEMTGDTNEDEMGPVKDKIVNPTACELMACAPCRPCKRVQWSHQTQHYPLSFVQTFCFTSCEGRLGRGGSKGRVPPTGRKRKAWPGRRR